MRDGYEFGSVSISKCDAVLPLNLIAGSESSADEVSNPNIHGAQQSSLEESPNTVYQATTLALRPIEVPEVLSVQKSDCLTYYEV